MMPVFARDRNFSVGVDTFTSRVRFILCINCFIFRKGPLGSLALEGSTAPRLFCILYAAGVGGGGSSRQEFGAGCATGSSTRPVRIPPHPAFK